MKDPESTIQKIHIDCDCGCDVLRIEKWGEEWGFIHLSMYKSSNMSLWQRIKQSWLYFRYGEFLYNDMTLKEDNLDKMIKFLIDAKDQK